MRNCFKKSPGGALASVAMLVLLATASSLRAQIMIDLNDNGMDDIWELIYGASALDPNVDTDGDGVINRLESIAGTNPFDSNSVPRISFGTYAGSNFSVTLPCALGKLYQLQSSVVLSPTNWSNWITEASIVVRSGTNLSLSAPSGPDVKFFRISISDVDSDGDGVNDWEEYQLGLDPFNAFSNGHLDVNGVPLNDYQYAVGHLASQNVVTITATTPAATEPDPGQRALNPGAFTLSRGGFPLNAITVSLGLGGPGLGFATEGLDYVPLPQLISFPPGVSSVPITLLPLANTNLAVPAIAMLNVLPGSGYTVGDPANASVVIYPSSTSKGLGLTAQYYTNSSSTYSNAANFNPTNLLLTRVDPVIDFIWGPGIAPNLSNGNYTVRWTGQIQPQFSETYVFDTRTDDGVRLWINDQLLIDKWVPQGTTDWTNSISLQAGVKYDLRMDYFQGGGSAAAHLYWYSPSQPEQVIPTTQLYATGSTPTPAAVTSPLTAVAFVGQPFSYAITAANSPLLFTANGLPPGLGYNSTNGLISGIPTLAGNYNVMLTASNSVGVGASVLLLNVINNASLVTREVWTGIPGTNISDIPLNTPANLTNTLSTLEGITDYGDNYGERITGYFTAPVTGNYYFWIAGSDSAELWISDDDQPANAVRRAYVLPTPNPTPPPNNGTAPRQWTLQPKQQSGWLTLVAGQQYYLQVLHKAGVGTNDNVSVAWLQDPIGTNTVPAGVVPGYFLSRYFPTPPSAIAGTLYAANMLAAAGVTNTPQGSATLRLSADGSQAVLNFKISGLSSGVIGEHIVNDPYLNNPSQILFDISAASPQPDGSYVWQIVPTGTLTNAADILEIINENKAYITVLTATYPNGELNGHFTLANGTQIFTPPPTPPAWVDDHADPNAAARFLMQASFGPSPAEIANVQAMGYANWINNQFSLPASHHLPVVLANTSADPTDPFPSALTFNTWWQQSITAPDQLRQRVAFALSEILVVSENGVLENEATALSSYYDILLDNAFGNFRNLLEAVTLSPAMGEYLGMQGNNAGSEITGLHADENYAREIQQLFSIGLNRMWPDGTLVMDSSGNLVPTYTQNTVMGFASVFTGWNYYQPNQANGRLPVNWYPSANYTNPMVLVPTHHELGTKLLLDNVMVPAAWGSQANPASTNFDIYCSQDLEAAMNSIFNHQNIGPFIGRELIQRLVTSSPSRDYVYRVAQAFNDNGSGVRGDMTAVITAILLDYEARSTDLISQPTYGKQREPLLRATAPARAFPPATGLGGTYAESGDQRVVITTTNAHHLANNDTVVLSFTDTSGNPAPTPQAYGVTVTSPTTFIVSAPGISSGSYAQTNTTITATVSGHGLVNGQPVYLNFTNGAGVSGLFSPVTVIDSSHFTVTASNSVTTGGGLVMPKWTVNGNGGYMQSKTNVTIDAPVVHGLNPGSYVYIDFTSGSPALASGQYQVMTVPDAKHFTVIVTNSANQTQNGLTVYPLVPPPVFRSGNVGLQESTWNMSYSDSDLTQTPLRSPTVFNFFYPGFEFPGPLAAAGLTTPEFQLTSDTTVADQMNFLEGGFLATGNTNGLTSFRNNGSIMMDLSSWMTTNYTSNAGIPTLINNLNTLLVAGQLSPAAQTLIVNYVANTTNFPYSTPPTESQMRDRARAVVHLILTSPDFTIQK